jgi:methyltransferase
MLVAATFVALVAQRMLELRVARRNAARAHARGAREFGARHYPVFFALHGGWMLGWALEAIARGPALSSMWPIWLLAIALAQGLRYWAIASLGDRWNTRVLVVAGDQPVHRGPYRWLAHPNYVAVVIELACVPMLFDAWLTAAIASIANLVVLLGVRIPCERDALGWAAARDPD